MKSIKRKEVHVVCASFSFTRTALVKGNRLMVFKNELEVAKWMDSVDEHSTHSKDIREELEAAWLTIFGSVLSEEDENVQQNAWSHLCSAV